MRLLEWMVVQSPSSDWGVRELAAAMDWTPSTVHRILALLSNDGWITPDAATGRYRLGVRFMKLSLAAARGLPLLEYALPQLHALVEDCDETALLGLYDAARMEMTFVAAVESRQAVRYVADSLKDTWAPLHAGASGLAIFAFLSDGDQARVVEMKGLPRVTERTIGDPTALQARIDKIRQLGYACTAGERTPGAVGIGAPIFGPDGRVVGDVLLTVPEHRFGPALEERLAPKVVACADAITDQLAAGGEPAAAA
jgi:DNA-binding IclR family transcriptional regulator